MFRTRDFLLMSMTIAFLLLGIIITTDVNKKSSWLNELSLVDSGTEYKAVLPEPTTDNREQILEEMRKKVANFDQTKYLANLTSALPEEDKKEENIDDAEDQVVSINKCVNYTDFSPVWSPVGLKFEVVEGARIVYRESASQIVVADEQSHLSDREVVVQLPLRSVSSGLNKCLSSGIIGIALDGSLINNTDYTAYKIFSAETLVGYALDGFPIYGLNSEIHVDQCGGASTEGQYRYFLSEEREGMIGCFSSEPISL